MLSWGEANREAIRRADACSWQARLRQSFAYLRRSRLWDYLTLTRRTMLNT
jgi:hypothetical protein